MQEIQQSTTVGFAMGCDIAMNYPLWVAAKRLSVGMTAFPSTFRAISRGGGSLFLSLGPTTIIEDLVTRSLQQSTIPLPDIVSAAASGVVAAVLVTSQVEHVITRAHSMDTSMGNTLSLLHKQRGISGLIVPPGMGMMICREIPFAATLFHVRPALTQFVQEQDVANGIDIQTIPWYLWIGREFGLGCITSIVASPISHVR